jgi:transposase
MTVGRPKLDPAVMQRIVDLVRAGNFLGVAAKAAGIHRSSVHRWLHDGRAQKRGRYYQFVIAVEKAQAESESRDVMLIAKAAGEDWRTAAWRLERKWPRRYGTRVKLAIQQELEAVIGRLEGGLAAEDFKRVLQLMTAEDEEIEQPLDGTNF